MALTTMSSSRPTRLVIIGGVAAGATAAARARRLDETADITLIEQGPYVSYANCGLPYFISGDITSRGKLLLQTPEGFKRRYGVTVRVNTRATRIDREHHLVHLDSPEGATTLPYDRLILAQGGSPIRPKLPGVEAAHVFTLWSVPEMDALHQFIAEKKPVNAVVVGGGFIGLEMAEAFVARGVKTRVVELTPTVMPLMDEEFGRQIAQSLTSHGVAVETGVGVTAINADAHTVTLSDGRAVPADLVLLSVGVSPHLTLARDSGLTIGASGGLHVDPFLTTSDPHIFAAGDMVEITHRISGRQVRLPLAGPANRQGRIAATNALGGHIAYRGALGTSVVKLFDATAAMTGFSEKAARASGLQCGVAVIHKDHHASYYPGSRELSLKLIYEVPTGRILGAQAFGAAGVDKRIDVIATAIAGDLTVDDLSELDLAYAPPFSSANDPLNLVAFVAQNDLSGFSPVMTAPQLREAQKSGRQLRVLDVRTDSEWAQGHLEGAQHIPLDTLRAHVPDWPRDQAIAVHCKSGFRAHLALRILKAHGFTDVRNVTGGATSLALAGFQFTRSA